jgi:hypothetical protein
MPPSTLTVFVTQRWMSVGRGHVRDDGQRRAAGFGDLRRDREQLGLGAADQRDGGALGGPRPASSVGRGSLPEDWVTWRRY